MIILLDGSKGAGKTSTSEILLQNLENTIYLGIDKERRKLPIENKSRRELNKEAFEIILIKAKEALLDGKNIIIDCGLIPERIIKFENISKTTNVKLYKFFLKARKDTLLDRVRARDKVSNKDTNIERFNEVYDIIHSKPFNGFNIIETDKLKIGEIADIILNVINQTNSS